MVLIKFWLHISSAEQLRRFEARSKDPLRQWKLTPEDWRNRKKRPQYERAVEDMIDRTDHPLGRWWLLEAEDKGYARVKVLETVCKEIEDGLTARGFKIPRRPRTRK
jgi:polyphosphate kinase 2 (PPK2 family)